ncbi:MAG: hypothetical protein LBT27_08510 [Prevotellaceae bacterium]|nr:hypothetical protein [Prevotellaceae bacterium]
MKKIKTILMAIIAIILISCSNSKITDNMKDVTFEDYENYSGEKLSLSLEQTIDLFDSMNWNTAVFLYFPITDTNLFQIMYNNENQFLVEITNDSDDMIYHQKYADKETSKELIKEFFEKHKVDAESLTGFFRVPIMSKTLDEVMKDEEII